MRYMGCSCHLHSYCALDQNPGSHERRMQIRYKRDVNFYVTCIRNAGCSAGIFNFPSPSQRNLTLNQETTSSSPHRRQSVYNKMVQRVTYRRQGCYNTKSNRVRIIKTPGNTLRYQHLKKRGTVPNCGDCGHALSGIPALRPREFANISKTKKTVQRAYGGSRCAKCVHDRIVRAFLIEEQQVSLFWSICALGTE